MKEEKQSQEQKRQGGECKSKLDNKSKVEKG